MNLSKALLIALRTLPKAYVDDGTMVVEYGPQKGCVFVGNGIKGLPFICYYPSLKKWKKVIFETQPTTISGPDFNRPGNLVTGMAMVGKRPIVFTPTSQHEIKVKK